MVFHVSGGLAAACGGLLTCFRHFHEKLFRKKQNRLRYTALVETALPQNTLTSGSPNPAFSVRSLNFLFFFFLGGQSSVLPRKPGEEAQPRLTFQTPVSRTPRFQFCWRSLLPAEVFFSISLHRQCCTPHSVLWRREVVRMSWITLSSEELFSLFG